MGADPIPTPEALKAGFPGAETSSVANEATRAISRRSVSWDPAVGVLTVGERSVTLTCETGDNECILRTYLHLVADQRDVALDRSVVLRRDDVLVLAELLDLDDVRLEQRLASILRLSGAEATALRRDLLRQRLTYAALGVGLVAGVPFAGAAAADDAPAPTAPATRAEVVEVLASPDSTDRPIDVAAAPTTVAVTVEATPPARAVTDPPAVAASAPTPAAPPVADPPVETEIGYSVTYERDPDFVPPEGVEIGDAMVIERDLPAAPEDS